MKRPDPAEIALARLSRVKQRPAPIQSLLGPAMVGFFKQAVAKRQTKLCQIAEAWNTLVPVTLAQHASLESLHRGTLCVLVDSSSHLYELKQLLLAGLSDQLILACRVSSLRKISLKIGRWYDGDEVHQRPRFEE